MATKLDKVIKREIELDGQAYMVTIAPDGVKLTQKGFRKGRELSWRALWEQGAEEGSGSAARGGAGGGAKGTASGTGGGSGGALGGESPAGAGGQVTGRAEH